METPPQRPQSIWLEAERRSYAAALAKAHADILVLPFQIQSYGFDRIERALLSADLAYAIGTAGSQSVADPFLVSLALGEGTRRIDSTAAQLLAEKIGAKKIIVPYVGHDKHHAFTLTLQVYDASKPISPAGQKPWQHDWRAVAFTDEKTPALVFHEMLPEVLGVLPLGLAPQKAVRSRVSIPQVVSSAPAALAADGAKDTAPAATLNLLGALTSANEERSRERLFERALLMSLRSRNDTPDGRFLESYALMNLWRRPAALQRLAGLQDPPAVALRALLNGELPAARRATAKVVNPFQQLLLQVVLRDTEVVYRTKERTDLSAGPRLFAKSLPAWEPFLLLRADDRDRWFVGPADLVKAAFDAAFPVSGLDAASVLQGKPLAERDSPADIDLDIASGRHARQVTENLPVAPCCHARDPRVSRWDLLWLLQGLAEARIDKSLAMETIIRAAPEDALVALARYERFFAGHPIIAVASAQAAQSLEMKARDDERQSLEERHLRDGIAAAYWAQGQTMLGLRAILTFPQPARQTQFWIDSYGYDYPRRPFWFEFHMGSRFDPSQRHAFNVEALAFSRDDPSPGDRFLIDGSNTSRQALQTVLGSRFTGHFAVTAPQPGSAELNAMTAPDRIANLEGRIKAQPEEWWPYHALATYLIESGGSLQEAQSAALRYPRLRDMGRRDSVEFSNRTYEFGSILFWLGEPELARPFYQVSADLNTGSAASLSSEMRLHVMDGDYTAASQAALDELASYPNAWMYRDHLAFVHAFGEHEAGWRSFSQIKASFDVPQAWLGAFVGQRMQGLDEARVRAWLKSPEIRDARFRTQISASWYAVIWNATDRVPPADLGKLVEEIEGTPAAFIEGGYVTYPSSTPDRFERTSRTVNLTGKPPQLAENTPVKSERAYFADAYAATARGDYPTAYSRFVAMSELYPVDNAALGYFAYAAAKTGDRLGLEKQFASLQKSEQLFDVGLARAFFAAGRKDVDGAYRALVLAFRSKPYSNDRPILTEYQYAQACEWLYRDTHDERFTKELLAWVKKHQVIQPAQGWAYAMQYSYEKDPAERIRALAMARYLDPAAGRIAKAPATEVAKAAAWFKANNPFRERETPRPESETTASLGVVRQH